MSHEEQEHTQSAAGSGPAERSGAGADPADARERDAIEPSVDDAIEFPEDDEGPRPRRRRRRGRALVSPEDAARATRKLTPEQRLLTLDAWQRSGLPARDFAALVGVSHHTLYAWKRRFAEYGPEGLVDGTRRRPSSGSRLPEATKRAIVMMKQANPDWGCQRISDMLYRGPGLGASANAVGRVLKQAGYVMEETPTRPHRDHVRRFERARPNQLWQTDLFTFVLKRQNRRVYLVAFMDDHSRFVVGYGIHASQNAALVLEVFRACVTSCGVPEEVLTDNGAQYVTWRGKSQFSRELEKRGVKHIVSSPRKPRTLGKIERFWGTLWRECLESAIFIDLADARKRVGLFVDHYNFHRPHQGIDGLVPADRFFGAAPQVLETLKARVEANALDLARNGTPKDPFYVTGQVGGKPFSVHADGERIIMVQDGAERREVDLVPPPEAEDAKDTLPNAVAAQGVVESVFVDANEPDRSVPGTSPLDGHLARTAQAGDADDVPVDEPVESEGDAP